MTPEELRQLNGCVARFWRLFTSKRLTHEQEHEIVEVMHALDEFEFDYMQVVEPK